MLIALTITVDLGDDYDNDNGEMPDVVMDDMDTLLAKMEELAAKTSIVASIHDQEWVEV